MQRMVEIYCAGHHVAGGGALCPECLGFLDYVDRRLEKCPYGPEKPTCARCPIHCYKPEPREHARAIMRYSGPRMAWRHPWLSLMHLADKLRRVEHPMDARRRERSSNQDSGGA
jgi:predicted amidophosphoribosyltransferase